MRSFLEAENLPPGVRRGKPEAGNPPLDPVRRPLEAVRGAPGVEIPAPGVGVGRLEVENEPLEVERQRLEAQDVVLDSACRLRKIEDGALEHRYDAELGQNAGLDRADRRQAGDPLFIDNRELDGGRRAQGRRRLLFFDQLLPESRQ